jgi:acetoin utilization protein AcuB
MKIQQLMSTQVVSVEMDDDLGTIKTIFDNAPFHHLLVVDPAEAGKLIGIISDRDLLKAVSHRIGTASESAQDLASLNKRAHQVMTRKPSVLFPDSTLSDAVELFCEQTISCIPVVNAQGQPVGILSWRDILKTLRQQSAQQ